VHSPLIVTFYPRPAAVQQLGFAALVDRLTPLLNLGLQAVNFTTNLVV
jgi:hypothetical protein